MKKLIIVDDHALLREGISSWITKKSDWNIVIAADSFEDLKKKYEGSELSSKQEYKEDTVVAVVDLSYKTDSSIKEDVTGWKIISWLKERNVSTVVFSSHDSGHYIEKAMSADVGASGFVSKCSTEKTLLEAIDCVSQGKTYIQPDLFSKMIYSRNLFHALSPKEQQIAELILEGDDNTEIANKLVLNIRTVENYVSKLYDKCGTNTRKGLIDLLSK